jgi:hypothetical protein
MGRARNIKPGFFKNEDLADLDHQTRLLFIGLWTIADRDGRFENRPRKIKAELFPYESVDVEVCINRLCSKQFLSMYEVGGEQFIEVVNWSKHQKPHHRETPSDIPAPPKEKRKAKQRDTDASAVHQSCINEPSSNEVALCPTDSLIPDSGFSDSGFSDSGARTVHDSLDPIACKRFMDYRTQIRKPIKPVSILAAQRKLAGFGADQAQVVEQSIANSWTGLFELKERRNGNFPAPRRKNAAEQAWDDYEANYLAPGGGGADGPETGLA